MKYIHPSNHYVKVICYLQVAQYRALEKLVDDLKKQGKIDKKTTTLAFANDLMDDYIETQTGVKREKP